MNSLSWFLYAIDVVNVLGAISALTAMLGLAAFIIVYISYQESVSDLKRKASWYARYPDESDKNSLVKKLDEVIDQRKFHAKWRKTSLVVAIISVLMFIFLPSSKTMYLILGSEIGEDVVQSETAKRVHNVINKKLDEYLGEDSE